MVVIGITGPTGAGKTTALEVIREMGGCVVDADAVYHRLLRENADLLSELEGRFGALRTPEGNFDRKKLGGIVFRDSAALADLNSITHRYITSAIREELHTAALAGCPVAAVDAVGLLESGLGELCQATVAVTAPDEVRIRRIIAREGISEDYARTRVAAQESCEYFSGRCGYTLNNDCDTAEEFAALARDLFGRILQEGGSEHGRANE